jgi:hypothetical protein
MDYGDWKMGAPQLDPGVMATIQALRRPNATAPQEGAYWQRTWPGANEVEISTVDQSPWGGGVQGWTNCDKDRKHCQIMILKNANRQCVEEHERKHAAGYDHPNHPRAYICPE